MMISHTIRTIIVSSLFAIFSVTAANAQPAQTQYNCQDIYGKKAKETYHLPAAQIEYCAMRGWDTPGKMDDNYQDYNWQPAGGKPVRTGTAGSLQIGAKQPPATPPGASANSTPTGSTGNITFYGTQPNTSSQCFDLAGQRACPRCGLANGNNVCEVPYIDPATGQISYRPATGNEEERVLQPRNPVAGDVGGQLGPIRIAGNGVQLPCGGTLNLSNIEVSTVKNATHLAIANPHGAYEPSDVQEYACDANQPPPQVGSDGNPLPPAGGGSYNCPEVPETDDGEDDASQVRLVDVYARNNNVFQFLRTIRLAKKLDGVDKDNKTRPIRQFIFFNLAQGQVALRAIQPREDAQEQGGEQAVVYNTADEEKYVIVTTASLISGTSRPSKEKFTRYPTAIPDFRMVPPQASEDITMELPLNTDACKDRVLHLDLTTPNLVHQPGTTLNIATISNRNEKATVTGETSILYFQPETFLRLAVPGVQFTFRGSVAMELPFRRETDPATLHMYGPTTITGGLVPQINLGGGGHTEDAEGNIVQRFPPAANFVPPGGIKPPYYIVADEKIYLPSGLTLMNESNGYVRQPSCPPPSAENPCATPPAGCPLPISCPTGP